MHVANAVEQACEKRSSAVILQCAGQAAPTGPPPTPLTSFSSCSREHMPLATTHLRWCQVAYDLGFFISARSVSASSPCTAATAASPPAASTCVRFRVGQQLAGRHVRSASLQACCCHQPSGGSTNSSTQQPPASSRRSALQHAPAPAPLSGSSTQCRPLGVAPAVWQPGPVTQHRHALPPAGPAPRPPAGRTARPV